MSKLSSSEESAIDDVIFVCSVISLITNVFVLAVIIIKRRLLMNKLSIKLIIALLISDLIIAAGNVLSFHSYKTGTPSCNIQGFFLTFGSVASFGWVSVMSYWVYSLLLHPEKWKDPFRIRRFTLRFHIIIWGASFIFAIIPLSLQMYNNEGLGWCWIKKGDLGQSFRLIFHYIWLVMAVVCCVYFNVKVYRYLYSDKDTYRAIHSVYPMVTHLRYTPLIFVLCWFPSMIQRIWNAIQDVISPHANAQPPFPLILLSAIGFSLFGTLMAILFGSIVYKRLKYGDPQRRGSIVESVPIPDIVMATSPVRVSRAGAKKDSRLSNGSSNPLSKDGLTKLSEMRSGVDTADVMMGGHTTTVDIDTQHEEHEHLDVVDIVVDSAHDHDGGTSSITMDTETTMSSSAGRVEEQQLRHHF